MKKFVSLTFAFIITISWANGQYSFHSLEEIWSFALDNNPDNVVYQLKVEKSIKDQKTANSYLYPKINIGILGQYNMEIPEIPSLAKYLEDREKQFMPNWDRRTITP